jgi:hypothetical protein
MYDTSLTNYFYKNLFNCVENSLTIFNNLINKISSSNLEIYSLENKIKKYEEELKTICDSTNTIVENKNKMHKFTLSSLEKKSSNDRDNNIKKLNLEYDSFISSINKRSEQYINFINNKINELTGSLESAQKLLETTYNLYNQEVDKVNSTAKFDFRMKYHNECNPYLEYYRYNDYITMLNIYAKIMKDQQSNDKTSDSNNNLNVSNNSNKSNVSNNSSNISDNNSFQLNVNEIINNFFKGSSELGDFFNKLRESSEDDEKNKTSVDRKNMDNTMEDVKNKNVVDNNEEQFEDCNGNPCYGCSDWNCNNCYYQPDNNSSLLLDAEIDVELDE